MKTKKFNTSFGEVEVKFAMIDVNGTDLYEGVEFYLEGNFVGDAVGLTLKEVNKGNIEEHIRQCNG